MKELTMVIFVLSLLSVVVMASPSFGAPSCNCSVSCDNGSSCSASGGDHCNCSCSIFTGDAECTGSGTAGAVNAGGKDLLVGRFDAVQVALEATVSHPESLLLLLQNASRALIMGDARSYESTLLEIDAFANDQMTAEEDAAFANVLRSLTP